MMSNLSLKVLVWDEYVECAKQLLLQAVEIARQSHSELNEKLDSFLEKQEDGKIARFEIQVLGIREVKGSEYDDIVVLNFFSAKIEDIDGSGEVWRSIPKACEKSWKTLVRSDVATAIPEGTMDLQIELQLKMLYTACSRCRCRLVFVETEETAANSNFFRKLRELEFISQESSSTDIKYDELQGRTRVQDDWACEAVCSSSTDHCAVYEIFHRCRSPNPSQTCTTKTARALRIWSCKSSSVCRRRALWSALSYCSVTRKTRAAQTRLSANRNQAFTFIYACIVCSLTCFH